MIQFEIENNGRGCLPRQCPRLYGTATGLSDIVRNPGVHVRLHHATDYR
jgi:hypothetical protein